MIWYFVFAIFDDFMKPEAPHCYLFVQNKVLRFINVSMCAFAQPSYGFIVILLIESELDHRNSDKFID